MEKNTEKGKQNGRFWNFIDQVEGDKVVWIVVLTLIMISVVAIFSSTPLLIEKGQTRLDIFKDQMLTVCMGLSVLWILYRLDKMHIDRIKFFMNISQIGFISSFILLTILSLHLNLGIIKAQYINFAWRTLSLFGFQIHVFEFTKVAMVMYIAWACHNYKKDQELIASGKKSTKLFLGNFLGRQKKKIFSFFGTPLGKRFLYLYIPVGLICGMVLLGSGSSAIFIGVILLATMLIGGIPIREVVIGGVIGLMLLLGGYGLYKVSDGKIFGTFGRVSTMVSRIGADYNTEKLSEYKIGSPEFYKERDNILQPYGAKIAVHEGGLAGKGLGSSTQKYIVTNMYGDYMYSFLLEEFGLIAGIIIIILYGSLLARGSIIARMCTKEYTKLTVGGLTLLITGQAFMHMFVNVDIGPMTGQTLPLVSHGAFAFLMFCIAFGVILSISKLTKEQMQKAQEEAIPLYERTEDKSDDIQASMDILEQIDNT